MIKEKLMISGFETRRLNYSIKRYENNHAIARITILNYNIQIKRIGRINLNGIFKTTKINL